MKIDLEFGVIPEIKSNERLIIYVEIGGKPLNIAREILQQVGARFESLQHKTIIAPMRYGVKDYEFSTVVVDKGI